jgi:hypothetical protein
MLLFVSPAGATETVAGLAGSSGTANGPLGTNRLTQPILLALYNNDAILIRPWGVDSFRSLFVGNGGSPGRLLFRSVVCGCVSSSHPLLASARCGRFNSRDIRSLRSALRSMALLRGFVLFWI